MKYLSVEDILRLHEKLIELHGGEAGLRDMGLLESAVAQPQATFGGEDLNKTLIEKAAALAFSLVKNHAFVDGNKRIAQMAMETFLALNGYELFADVDEQEAVFVRLVQENNNMSKDDLAAWIEKVIIEKQ